MSHELHDKTQGVLRVTAGGHKILMPDLRFPPSCQGGLCSSEMLHSVDWQLVIDVSEQPIRVIFKGKAAGLLDPWRRERQAIPKRRQLITNQHCVMPERNEGLKDTDINTWPSTLQQNPEDFLSYKYIIPTKMQSGIQADSLCFLRRILRVIIQNA